jgi:hypothetical protein
VSIVFKEAFYFKISLPDFAAVLDFGHSSANFQTCVKQNGIYSYDRTTNNNTHMCRTSFLTFINFLQVFDSTPTKK